MLSEKTKGVLISTYWNVNVNTLVLIDEIGTCFNLNLLECKLVNFVFKNYCGICFNLNLLECKLNSKLKSRNIRRF